MIQLIVEPIKAKEKINCFEFLCEILFFNSFVIDLTFFEIYSKKDI